MNCKGTLRTLLDRFDDKMVFTDVEGNIYKPSDLMALDDGKIYERTCFSRTYDMLYVISEPGSTNRKYWNIEETPLNTIKGFGRGFVRAKPHLNEYFVSALEDEDND